MAQFIKSFKSRGLKVRLYYCWRHPGFYEGKNKGKFEVLPPECDPATHSLKEQIEFRKKQIAELVGKYPDAFYIWNDGPTTSRLLVSPHKLMNNSGWWLGNRETLLSTRLNDDGMRKNSSGRPDDIGRTDVFGVGRRENAAAGGESVIQCFVRKEDD